MAALLDIIDRPRKTFLQAKEHPQAWVWPAIWIIVSMAVVTLIMSAAQSSAFSTMTRPFASTAQPFAGAGAAQGLPSAQQGTGPSGQAAPSAPGQASASPAIQGTPAAGQAMAPGAGGFPQGTVTASAAESPYMTLALKFALLVVVWLLIAGLGGLLVRLMHGKASFRSLFTMGVLASIPFFYRNVTQLIYHWVTKRVIIGQGLAFLVPTGPAAPANSAIVSSLLANIDPFGLWFYLLLGIGLSAVAEIKGWKAALITVILVAVFAGIRLIPLVFNLGFTIPIIG